MFTFGLGTFSLITSIHSRPCTHLIVVIEFSWEKIRFAGGITDFQFKFTLFDSDATPKRAEVTMGMKGRYLVDGDGSMPKDGHVNLLVPKTISSTATSKKKL